MVTKEVEIIAQAFDPLTGSPRGNPRVEKIYMGSNKLFKECETLTDVTETYMRFWNRLAMVQHELVLVQSIRWV
jgi:hypothetical protein